MARQLKGAKPPINDKNKQEVANKTKPQNDKKKTNQSKSGGLFGLFKSQGKKSRQVADEDDDDYDDTDEVYDQEDKYTERQPAPTKVEVKGDTEKRKVANPHEKPSKESIQNTYSQKRMKQNVFMYMAPKLFPSAQKYYNDSFDEITILGTSSLDMLIDEFKKRTLCNAILLFVFSENEVKPLYHFLSNIGFGDLDRRILTVYVVPKEGIDISMLIDDKIIGPFVALSEPIKLDKDNPLVKNTLDKAISGVVQNQPVYVEDKVKAFEPKKTTRNVSSISNVYKVDIEKVQERVNSVKSELYKDEAKAKVINSLAKSTDTIEQTLSETPHIKVIEEVERDLDDYIETLRNSPHMKGELKRAIEDKFLVSSLKAAEVGDIVDEIVKKVEKKLDTYDRSIDSINRNAISELNDQNAEAMVMIEKRKQITDELERKYLEYKALTNLLTSGNSIHSRYLGLICNEMSTIIKESGNTLSTDTLSIITSHIKSMKIEINELKEGNKVAEERFARAIDMTNGLIKDFKFVMQYDTVLIDKLCDIIQLQEASKDVNRYTDTLLKTVGVAIVKVDGSGLDQVFNLILGKNDLVLYIGDREQAISDNQIDLSEFLSTTWAPTERCVINVPDSRYLVSWKSVKNIDRVINKLNYVAKYFNNIYVIYNVESKTSTLQNELFIRAVREIGSICYGVMPRKDHAVTVNMLHNNLFTFLSENELYSTRVIINKVTKDFSTDVQMRSDFRVTMGVHAKDITIPYRKDIADGTADDSVISKLKTLKNALK